MVNKMVLLVIQIIICISLLWLAKGISGELSITYLVIAYILSYVLTKGLGYWVNQRKMRGIEENTRA